MDTFLLEFRLKREQLKEGKEKVVKELEKLVQQFLTKKDAVFKSLDHGFTIFYTGQSGDTVLLRWTENGVLTVNVDSRVVEGSGFDKNVRDFEEAVRALEVCQKPRVAKYLSLPAIKRGEEFSRYDVVSGYLVERDIDRVVFDEASPFQHVRILHSPQYGNILFLDNDLNLAESDLEYTRAITGFDLEDYKNKTALILGGGDGGILHYLRDRGPRMITMIDIDQMVIDAAKVHLRGICHDALDCLTGHNYEVIVDDCIKYLEKYIDEGRKFDYIINDLTAIPVSTEPVGDHWDFLRRILSLSMKVLENSGKYFTQGNSQLQSKALEMYEKQLNSLECSVDFDKKVVCVPSYLENWIFYKVWKI